MVYYCPELLPSLVFNHQKGAIPTHTICRKGFVLAESVTLVDRRRLKLNGPEKVGILEEEKNTHAKII